MAAAQPGGALRDILGRLEGVRRSGNGYEARCPVHEDGDPSLSVNLGDDGRVLLHCHRGCDPGEVVAALGLKWRDLFPLVGQDGRALAGYVRTTRYSLHDDAGQLIAVHVRRDKADGKKQVWWERPDGQKGLGGIALESLPLYRVDQIEQSSPIVFVTEGEKAADALATVVEAVVGTATGAEKTPDAAVLAKLAGREVVLWPDNDAIGRRHMENIAAVLSRLDIPCRIIEWPDAPPKGDAADFVAAGLGRNALRALYLAASPWEPPSADEPDAEPVEVEPEAVDVGAAVTHLTDLGNSARLIARHGADIRWCDEMGQWFHWTGVIWNKVTPTILQDLAKETVLALFDEAMSCEDREQQVQVLRWAKTSSSARAIASMVALTKTSLGEIAIDAETLDADPMLLGVENGVVDLTTGVLRPARREDYITKSCRVAFDPDADCPLWRAFLERIFDGDAELIAYVQRAIGYVLTGKTGERVVFIAHGSGANGKSTLVEVIAHLLGTYATSTPVETLIARKDRGIPNDVARLKSARFVSAVESERGGKLAESFIKQITGGDRVTARFLHKEFFDFVPQLKLWLATNHRPEISNGGKAVWGRIRLLPFEVEIPVDERDPDLKAKLIAEAPGILTWAVEGCLEWQRTGLREPQSIKDANARYEEDEDVLGAFVEERCELDPNVWTSSTDLYESFTAWAKAHGEEQQSMKAFSQALAERRGLKRHRQMGSGVRGFTGIRLLEQKSAGRKRQEDGLDDA